MQYEWQRNPKKGGGFRLSRVAIKTRKGAVTIEPAEPPTVAKVDLDSGDVVAVEPVTEPVVEAAPVAAETPKANPKPRTARKPAAKKGATRG
jgi:hypothetical protein